jgi:hypothetical protein
MSGAERVVLVVDTVDVECERLRELIEFMDTPNVCTSSPANWRATLGERRLEALFLGPDLSDGEIDVLLADVGKLDPNVAIVMMNMAKAG